MLEVLLIRHGETDWNVGRRIMGRSAIPLNDVGQREARRMADLLENIPINAAYTSPVLRAVQTTETLLKSRTLSPIHALEIAEIEYGDWVGKTFEEVSHEGHFRAYHTSPSQSHPPGGERMLDVGKRVNDFIETLRVRHPEGRILLVSHADVIKIALMPFLGLGLDDILKFRIDNCSVSVIRCEGKHPRVTAINCTPTPAHLFTSPDSPLELLLGEKTFPLLCKEGLGEVDS